MDFTKILWLINRLEKMSLQEIIWRVQQKKQVQIYQKLYKKKSFLVTDNIYANLKQYQSEFNLSFLKLNKNIELNPSDCTLEKVFNHYFVQTESNQIPKWHASYHKKEWPCIFYAELDIKQRDDIGDPRVCWEVNRLHHFPKLAYEGSKESLSILQKSFDDWVLHNPFMWGINWTSPMEAAIRNLSLIFTLKFAQNEMNDVLVENMKAMILTQYGYVKENYSQFSSANNHLLIELMANHIVEMCFAIPNQSTQYLLESEILKQHHEDGVNKEQAIHYHAFVLEATLFWLKCCDDFQLSVSTEVTSRIEKMTEYIADMMDSQHNVPNLGDSDDGKILSLVTENHYEMVLELASLLFGKKYINISTVTTVQCIQWKEKNDLVHAHLPYKEYAEGGKSIIRQRANQKDVFLVFEYGELGMAPLYAHGHAHALSLYLTVNGYPTFIDPGTYIYNIDYKMRTHFKKAKSHNTVVIDNDDFAEIKGAFMWEKPYGISFNKTGKYQLNGMLKTAKKHRVTRSIILKENVYVIEDWANVSFESRFTLHPTIEVNECKDGLELLFQGEVLLRMVAESVQFEVVESYFSETFTKLSKTKTIIVKNRNTEQTKILLIF